MLRCPNQCPAKQIGRSGLYNPEVRFAFFCLLIIRRLINDAAMHRRLHRSEARFHCSGRAQCRPALPRRPRQVRLRDGRCACPTSNRHFLPSPRLPTRSQGQSRRSRATTTSPARPLFCVPHGAIRGIRLRCRKALAFEVSPYIHPLSDTMNRLMAQDGRLDELGIARYDHVKRTSRTRKRRGQ
jgi:hypothetical protein